ncbi:MAG: DUF4270 domain-containing protein [Flavobacteriaceae bacterium]|nr:DUF4270 domain-containing protein [Flavobacteriaceae bacterium]
MSNRIMTSIKNIGLVLMLFFGIVSCEKDFEDIAIDLVDNDKFSVGNDTIEIIAYNSNVEKSRVDNNNLNKQPLSLLGVNSNKDFGYIKSVLISQLSLPLTGVNFGGHPSIDKVVLDMPYLVKDTIVIKEITDDRDTIYESVKTLDSIYGNRNKEYQITVSELGTFLNTLDPEDPTKGQEYYSDRSYEIKDQIYSGNFKPDVNDTVIYIHRDEVILKDEEGEPILDPDGNYIYDVDTIKATDLNPSIKMILDSDFFKTRFVDQSGSGDFANNDSFRQYFRGLYIDANGSDGSLMNLDIAKAKVSIYYTNDDTRNEEDGEDLDGDGVSGEADVIVGRKKQTMHFSLSGVKSNKYIRDYTAGNINNVLFNPDKINGEEKLYIQGAAGSEAILDLISEEEIEELRSKNWLINDAILTFYVDGYQEEVPEQLFLYNYDYNSNISDVNSFLYSDVFGGNLEYKRELVPGSMPPRYRDIPEKYTFRITKYLTDLLDVDRPKKPSKLALKNYVNTDTPSSVLDSVTQPYNWIPKGVVLKGNLPASDDKRIKLEIYYSK